VEAEVMFTSASLATKDLGYTDPKSKLIEAAGYGEVATVERLLDTVGIDINSPPPKVRGRTALQAAAVEGHVEVTKLLLQRGASANAPPADWYGRTPLQAAAQRGHADIVNILLEAGADVNAPPAPYYGRTALQAICSRPLSRSGSNDAEICKKLLRVGADVNAPAASSGGRTALQAAALAGAKELVNLLLEAGAAADGAPAWSQGVTALQAAAFAGHVEIIEILLAAGANLDEVNPCDGRTPLHTACACGNLQVARLLHKLGARFSVEQIGGRSCLHLAASYGRIDVLRWLLSLDGVEINAQDYGGATALHLAEYEPRIVDCLLRAGANTELEDFRLLKPLNLAVQRGSADIVEKLLRHGANVENISALEWRRVLKAKPFDTVMMVDDPKNGKSILVTDRDPGVNLEILASSPKRTL
jgi:ankyrin repeat protein